MKRLRLFFLLLTWLVGAGPGTLSAASAAHPNILFIMTDQHRWDCLGANGNPIIRTPNFDRLAAGAANFTHAFVSSPVCVPSRVSFFTGRYSHSHRNRVNYTPLDRGEVLMQARLKAAGYATATVGKLHLHPPTVEEAERTGFDVVDLHDASGPLDRFSSYVKWLREKNPVRANSYRAVAKSIEKGGNPFRAAIADEFSETTWTGLRARHHLENLTKGTKPFFLNVSFWKPHSPWEISVPWDRMYSDVTIPLPHAMSLEEIQRLPPPLQALILRGKPVYEMDREQLQWAWRSYYAAISQVDREVGLILDQLERSGAADNTVVVFSSDHGDQMLEHGLMGKNCFFDSSVRVPFMIRYPGRVKPKKHDDLIETVDLLPTLFELAGLPVPYLTQGRSLVPLITGDGRSWEPRTAVFSENVIPEVITHNKSDFAFEKGKGIKGTRHPDAKMVRTRQWKYNYYPDGFAELYNVERDPGERINLHGDPAYAAVEATMKDHLLKWLCTADEADQIAPRWLQPE